MSTGGMAHIGDYRECYDGGGSINEMGSLWKGWCSHVYDEWCEG